MRTYTPDRARTRASTGFALIAIAALITYFTWDQFDGKHFFSGKDYASGPLTETGLLRGMVSAVASAGIGMYVLSNKKTA